MAVHLISAVARVHLTRDLALLAALFAAMLVPLPEWVEGTPLIGSLANAFHGVLFAAVTLFVLARNRLHSLRNWITAALIAAGLAIATELIQSIGPRDPSWSDVRTDLLGIVAAMAFALFRLKRRSLSPSHRAALVSVAFAAVAVILTPVLIQSLHWVERLQKFPVLFSADFSDVLDMTESLGELEEVEIKKQDDGVDVALRSGSVPGIVISKFVADWKNLDALVFDVENPSRDSIALEFHVRDRGSSNDGSDRFNIRSTLAPGDRRSVRVSLAAIQAGPSGRQMRMDAIALIVAYRVAPGGDRFRIHSIRLE